MALRLVFIAFGPILAQTLHLETKLPTQVPKRTGGKLPTPPSAETVSVLRCQALPDSVWGTHPWAPARSPRRPSSSDRPAAPRHAPQVARLLDRVHAPQDQSCVGSCGADILTQLRAVPHVGSRATSALLQPRAVVRPVRTPVAPFAHCGSHPRARSVQGSLSAPAARSVFDRSSALASLHVLLSGPSSGPAHARRLLHPTAHGGQMPRPAAGRCSIPRVHLALLRQCIGGLPPSVRIHAKISSWTVSMHNAPVTDPGRCCSGQARICTPSGP